MVRIGTQRNRAVNGLLIDPSSQTIFAAHCSVVRMLDAETGTELWSRRCSTLDPRLYSSSTWASFDPCGRRVAVDTLRDGGLEMLEKETGKKLWHYRFFSEPRFTPNGKWLLTTEEDPLTGYSIVLLDATLGIVIYRAARRDTWDRDREGP